MVTKTVAPALKTLLASVIDYAGIFPPAALATEAAVDNFERYRGSQHSWMLHWFVLSQAESAKVPAGLMSSVSLLSDTETKSVACVEAKGVVKSSGQAVYCEVAPDDVSALDAIKQAGSFAKVRMGGVKAEAFPSSQEVSRFILNCADRKLAFKATAGLHHPIRGEYALTYEPNAPRATMHGFINLLMAACLAWRGERNIEAVLNETDPRSFVFDESAHWRSLSLTSAEIAEARTNFVHSIGSCSFEEPVAELQALGWI